jgi:hypothetical protein
MAVTVRGNASLTTGEERRAAPRVRDKATRSVAQSARSAFAPAQTVAA